MADTTTPAPLATPEEVATYRRTTTEALAQERYRGRGPKFKKLNGRVFYDWVEVTRWVEANTRQRTDDRPCVVPP